MLSIDEPVVVAPKPQFQSVVGVIFSCLGCVVGTGNLWRFPRIVARNSGEDGAAAFYLVWFISLFLWSIPLLVVEYSVGRFTHVPLHRLFTQFMGKAGFFLGGWITLINFFICGYYMIVLSWCVIYIFLPIIQELPATFEESNEIFDFYTKSYWPILPHAVCTILIGLSVIGGVKTIEKVNCVLVPLLLVILMAVFCYSMTLPFSKYGLQFLFTADWSVMSSPSFYLDAISQNAFDTGAGAGLITTYAIYLTRRHSIMRYSLFIPMINNFVSFLGSLTIFPTVFGIMLHLYPTITKTEIVQVMKGGGIAGTGLTFLWIPMLLGTLGIGGRILCFLFFVCLTSAGISSVISLMEMFCISAKDFGVNRKVAILITSISLFLLGLASLLNLNFLANQDAVWGFALIICGTFYVVLVWKYGPLNFRKTIVNARKSKWDFNLPYIWCFIITILTPIQAISLLTWWIYDEIRLNPTTWYIPGWTSLITTWIEWVILALILMIINIVLCGTKARWFTQDVGISNEGFDHRETNEEYTVRMPPNIYNGNQIRTLTPSEFDSVQMYEITTNPDQEAEHDIISINIDHPDDEVTRRDSTFLSNQPLEVVEDNSRASYF